MSAEILPEPPESEREAILAALAGVCHDKPGGWAETALAEAVETSEPDP